MVAQVVIKLALTAASMAMNAMRRIEGPRVDDLKVTSGDYGAAWPRVWGMRWLRPPVIWAEDLKEVKQTRKTKGGKYNEYTYYGSWAHGLACHELEAVRRIKFDGHLVYDASGAGPVTPFTLGEGGGKAGGTGGSISDYMAFYPGDFTQGVDPAIEADVDGRLGEGSTPAYRGRSYLRFHNLPLEKFGNRIPQVEVEVVALASPHYPFQTLPIGISLGQLRGAAFSPDYSRFMWVGTDSFEIWDVAGRARMIAGALPVDLLSQGTLGIYNSGDWIAASFYSDFVYRFEPDGTGYTTIYTSAGADYHVGGVRVVRDASGDEHWCGLSAGNNPRFVFDGTVYNLVTLTGVAIASARDCFADAEGSIWIAGNRAVVSGTEAVFYRIVTAPGASGPGILTVSGLVAAASTAQTVATVHYAGGGADQFVFAWGYQAIYAVDRLTGAVLHTNTGLGLDNYNTDNQFAAVVPGAASIWIGTGNVKEVSLADLSVLRTATMTDWTATSADGVIYDPINHALITGNVATITWRYLDRIGSTGVALGDVVQDVAVLAGIDPAQIDVSALTQVVQGYSVSGGTGKDWLEPLLDLYDVDPRPHGFDLQFLPRGGAAGALIASTDFARSEGEAPLFTMVGENGATDLPRQVTMAFADLAIEQQPGNAMSPPLFDGDGQRSQSLDMSSLALTADEARQLVARYARRQRFDARGVSHALPLSALDLEPGDVRPLDLAGVEVTARLQSMVLDADRRIALEWKGDDPSVAALDGGAGAAADGFTEPTIAVPLLSKGFALDIPLLSDLDEGANPVIYAAAAPYGAGTWPGATLLREQTGEYNDEVASIDSASAATWGVASGALGDYPATLWDRLSAVSVVLQTGSLTGCSEADLDADPTRNLAWWGGELVQFAGATLTAPNTYTVTTLKRGRRGTEWACGGHVANEPFVLLDRATTVSRPLSEVGTAQSYKAVTNGRTEAGAFPLNLDPFSGASKKPYAPCHLRAAKDAGTGDWALAWVRRTRIGGAWTGGAAIPLGEVSELYKVEIMDGATVKRTISGLTSPSATYTDAQQVTDWGVTQPTISWRVRQISDAVGDGYAAAA
jgi:hypothetical protein